MNAPARRLPRPSRLAATALAACLGLGLRALDGDLIVNGGFEIQPEAGEPVPGWAVAWEPGGDALPVATVEADEQGRRTGRRALRLAGDFGTRAWPRVTQELPARPGARYRLSAWTKTVGLRREGLQKDGCSVSLRFADATGATVLERAILPERPRERWTQHELDVVAPPSVRRVELVVTLTMSGELNVDDVELLLDGGWERPDVAVLLDEGFEGPDVLPAGFQLMRPIDGASSGVLAVADGAGDDGGRALRLEADGRSGSFFGIVRRFAVAAQDTLHLTARARGDGLLPGTGGGPTGLALSLQFLDAAGEPLGPARAVGPVAATFPWTGLALAVVAPEGAAAVQLGLSLDAAGRAVVDDLHLLVERGAEPAFTGWLELTGQRVIVHLPPDHPAARQPKTLLRNLDRAAEASPDSAALHLYLHRDAAAFRDLLGKDPPTVDPRTRAIHALDEEQALEVLAELLGA